ncbi:hypothetical protein ACHAXA_002699 [Cyclostephanos tholiformis]|uniref:Uncharacterized protein n=1 Tax=Cyclostephanos tholiformis TaxID=382380 RepID=A0ABD3S036_9STRA
MFTIKNIANQDVIIRGFDIINRRRNTTVITIYTQDGTLEELGDDALTMEGWNMIYQSQKMGDPMTLMPLDDFTAEVSIGVGQAKSFYVHSLNGLMYRKNDDTSDRMVSEITEHDGAIAILEGRVLRGLFRSYIGTGKFGGVVRYYTSQN